MESERVIGHVDMDAFFARVEKLDDSELENAPVIVGGLGSRGVVSTACYKAREFGVHSAMPMDEARNRCPDATFRSPRTGRYSEISKQVIDVLARYTPKVQKVSLDEAYLDLTGSLHRFQSRQDLAESIRESIRNETGLTASVGIAPNKMIAKLASDLEKPNGCVVVRDRSKTSFLAEIPVSEIPGIGPETRKRFDDLGIQTVGDLQDTDRDTLVDEFGDQALMYERKAEGINQSPVITQSSSKSISNEETYSEDLQHKKELKNKLYRLTEKVGRRLRNKELEARTSFIKVRRGDFTTLTRQNSTVEYYASTEPLWNRVRKLFQNQVSVDNRGIRLLGVGVTNLREAGVQADLFQNTEKQERNELNQLMDTLNKEYGEGSLVQGRHLKLEDDN